MIVFRIANEKYSSDLSGEGASLYGGRWNSVGLKVLYTSQYISLTILESMVHLRTDLIPSSQFLLSIEVPEKDIITISTSKIKEGWANEPGYSQWIGDQFINGNQGLVLKVPSAIVPEECNFLINPLHRDFKKVKLNFTEPLRLDKRLHLA